MPELSFILRLKDMLSGGMAVATANTQRSFNSIGQGAQAVNRNINSISATARRTGERSSASIAVLERALRRLEFRRNISVDTSQITKANKDILRLQEEISHLKGVGMQGGREGSMLGSIVGGNLISGGISRIAGSAKQVIMDSIDAAMEYGKSVKSFEVLTGSADRGRQLAGELRELKQSTIMGASVYKNAQTMMGFGIGDKEVIKDLRQIGDIAMGDQDRIQSLTLAFSQTRAAGKLMGQDLLQYINAGFNPLSVISDKWQEFGFKSKQSIGQLKKQMEDGKISSDMIAKAFELATSKGGKYYKMMDAIGETAAGQAMKLKGNWAAFQIDMGNALMPLANNFMQLGSDVLHFLNISKTVPETLRDERLEIGTLVSSITSLNQGNLVRGQMLDTLKAKYPDLFGNIDREKISNQELLGLLGKVNDAYEKRIQLAQYDFNAQTFNKEAQGLLTLAQKARMQATVFQAGVGGIFTNNRYLGPVDRLEAENSGVKWQGGFNSKDAYIAFAKEAEERAKGLMQKGAYNQTLSSTTNSFNNANALVPDIKKQKELWGKDFAKNSALFQKEMDEWRRIYKQEGGQFKGEFLTHDWSKLDSLTTAKTYAAKGGNGTDDSGSGGNSKLSAKGVTQSGPKVITVNFNKEFIGKLELNSMNVKEGVGEMEDMIQEAVYRIFYSLNSNQS